MLRSTSGLCNVKLKFTPAACLAPAMYVLLTSPSYAAFQLR